MILVMQLAWDWTQVERMSWDSQIKDERCLGNHIDVLLVNYGIFNTTVLEIP